MLIFLFILQTFVNSGGRYGLNRFALVPGLVAKFYRIDVKGYYSAPRMRLEFYGCNIDEEPQQYFCEYCFQCQTLPHTFY